MTSYDLEVMFKDGYRVIVLRDNVNNSIAEIVPEIGNNLFRFEVGGRRVLHPPISLNLLKYETTKYGTPILFPPNRVKNGRFTFNGRSYHLPLNEPPDNHLHGEISSNAWKVIDSGVSEEEGAFVTSRFSYASYPEIMNYFPHPLTFTITHRLHQGSLYTSGSISNEGVDEAPFALGFHPYFSIPFEKGENIVLKASTDKEWPISNEAFVLGKPAETDFSHRLNEGVPIETFPELGCSLFSMKAGESACRFENKSRGFSIVYRFDQVFPFLVLFRPDWSQSFSLEPYTYVTDAFNLPFEHKSTGVRGIASGEVIAFKTTLSIESY